MQTPLPVVRLILHDSDGRVLILRRANTDYSEGKWCLPGGTVDYGETVEETVFRELEEETGFQCEGSRFLFYHDNLPLWHSAMHCINLYFECQYSGEISLNSESSEYHWLDPKELDDYDIVFRNDEAIKRFLEIC